MSHSPFKVDKNIAMQLRVAEAQQRNAAMAAQRRQIEERLEVGNRAIALLTALAKKAAPEPLRVSSLVKHNNAPRDGITFGHDDETNEWTVTFGLIPDEAATEPERAATEPEAGQASSSNLIQIGK